MINEVEILFGGVPLVLNNQRSLFFPGEKMLVFSDLHLGKSAHFRKYGIALPDGVMENDISLIRNLVEYYKPEYLVVVGDMFHAGRNSETARFRELSKGWLPARNIIVQGNHDRFRDVKMDLPEFEWREELMVGGLQFVHEPVNSEQFVISGHIHPGVIVKAGNHQKVRLSCFLVSEKQIILPAFSGFTGLDTGYVKSNQIQWSVYAITPERILSLNDL